MASSLSLLPSLLLLSAVSCVSARDFYVYEKGNDGNAGTRQAPYRTISRAARELKPGDTCHVLKGIYEEEITSVPNGEPGRPVRFVSEVPHAAVLTGLTRVEGWARHYGDVWKATVEKTLPNRNQVFVNGEPAVHARWPKRVSKDWLVWDGVEYDQANSSQQVLACPKLPERPDDYWKGATVWVMGGSKWTSWSAKITGYDNSKKTLTYEMGKTSRSAGGNAMALEHPQGGYFYLLGDEREIAQANEYYIDETSKTLYLQVEPGKDPNQMSIQLQTRLDVINVKAAKYVQFIGFKTIGASIDMVGNCENCLLQDLRCSWLGSTDGGDTGYGLDVQIGVTVSGRFNVVRDSEIAFSHGNGIRMGGADSAVINCHIHDIDFLASYNTPVQLWGERNMVSHCTIHDTGRDCMLPGGQNNVIQYNNIYNMGRICHDLGATYVCGSDGGGTEYHHNWVHDNRAVGTRMGIYLDNFTCNNFIYKNVVWNIGGCDIRLNRPSHNNFVINNTMLGKCGNWGRWQTDWMYDCAYINNAVVGTIAGHPQLAFQHNTYNIPKEKLNIENFMTYTDGAGQGFAVPGITGDNPSIGAYEPGEDWRPGHDFGKHPEPVFAQVDTPLRNLIANGTFFRNWQVPQDPWRLTGPGKSKVTYGPGGILTCYTERDSIIGLAMSLNEDGDGIEQDLAGGRPGQKYEFCGWYKLAKDVKGAATLEFYVSEDGGIAAKTEVRPDDTWRMATLAYTPKAGSKNVAAGVVKHGVGVALVDSLAFVGVVAGMEPKLPGLAPVSPKSPDAARAPRRTAPLAIPQGQTVRDDIKQAPGRRMATGKPAQAVLSHESGVLEVMVTVPLEARPAIPEKAAWTKDDGVEVCFAFAEYNARQTVHVLHGFANGEFEASKEAGASEDECSVLKANTSFKADVNDKGWTASWRIDLKTMGLPYTKGTLYDFNLGIFRKEARQWLQWAGTSSQTWLVKEAAKIRLD